MGNGFWPLLIALLLGLVGLDLFAMRRLAHQRAPVAGEGWAEYTRLAPIDPAVLNEAQRRLVYLGRQRRQAHDAVTAQRLDEAMDDLVRRHRHLLS